MSELARCQYIIFLHKAVNEFCENLIKMMKFTKSGFLIGENMCKLSIRTLINGLALGMRRFENSRQFFKLKKNTSQFMYQINNSSTQELLHSTKLWPFMVTNLDGELDLLNHSLTRIYENCSEIQAENDVCVLRELGPMTMRMFHYLDLPKEALKFYSQFNNNSFYDSKATLTILMDLLFLHGKYQDILDIYHSYTVDRKREASFIHRTIVIAACYKLNTPESFQIAQNLRNDSMNTSETEMYQSKNFAAMLAINQKEPKLALNILSESSLSTTPMNIKLLAMAELNDWHGVADLLCFIKTKYWEKANRLNYRVSTAVFQKLMERLSEKDLSVKEYDRCNRVLMDFQKSQELLQKATMDQLLCWPIDYRPKKKPDQILQEQTQQI